MLNRIKGLFSGSSAPAAGRRFIDADVIEGACTLGDACSGIAIVGGPGSGKTSTVGRELRRNLLRLGCGGLVLCAKPGEYANLQRDCELTNRSDSLVRFSPEGAESCDVINAELSSPGGSVDSAASLLDLVAEMDGRRRGGGDGDGKYWVEMNSKAFRFAIASCWLVRGSCSLVDIYKMFATAPISAEQVADPAWREKSFCWQVLAEGMQKIPDNYDFALAATFWLNEFANLSDKTRTICVSVATNLLNRFLSGPMMRMVASGITTHGPETALDGKILAIDMPVLLYQEQGVFFANIMKTLFQRRALRRDVRVNPRPVFCFMDECQFYLSPNQDMMVSTVARESRLINVVMFQNLPMLYTALGGGDKARQDVDGLLSCLMTKIALTNTCVATGEYFSKLFGASWEDVWSESIPTGGAPYSFSDDLFGRGQRGGGGMSMNRTPHWRPDVPLEEFGRLAKPSPGNPWAEGFVFQGGRVYENGKPWKRMQFRQQF
jgi:hypothetical protein